MAYLEEMEEKEEKMEEMPEEGESEEMEMKEDAPSGSSGLKMKIRSMLEDLSPEGPEEEDLVEQIKALVSEDAEEGMEEDMEEDMEDEDMAPGPSMGFDIVAMRKRAAKNAFPEM